MGPNPDVLRSNLICSITITREQHTQRNKAIRDAVQQRKGIKGEILILPTFTIQIETLVDPDNPPLILIPLVLVILHTRSMVHRREMTPVISVYQ